MKDPRLAPEEMPCDECDCNTDLDVLQEFGGKSLCPDCYDNETANEEEE